MLFTILLLQLGKRKRVRCYLATTEGLQMSTSLGGREAVMLRWTCVSPNPLQDRYRAQAAREPGYALTQAYQNKLRATADLWGIMANMVLCVIPGQGNSKILNLFKSGSFDSPIFLYIPNDETTSTGYLFDRNLLFDSLFLKSVVPE